MKIKLNSLVKYPLTINYPVRTESGRNVQRILRLIPGKGYELLEEMAEPVSEIKKKVDYSAELENELKARGIAYDIVKGCGSCPGKRKKIEFSVLEVIE